MAASRTGEFYFQAMAWISLIIVIAGFGLLQLLMPEASSPFGPLVIAHAVVFFAWYALLVTQPHLIKAGNYVQHRKFGFASLAIAVLILVLGYLATAGAYARPGWSIAGMDPAGSVIFPLTDIVNFAIVYTLGFALRANAIAHKRLMLLAGLLMLDPAFARLWGSLGLAGPLIPLSELALFGSLLVYDWRTLGKLHWTSILGVGLWATAMTLKFTISETDGWRAFVDLVFG